MFWTEQVKDELYLYYNGILIMKFWQSQKASILFDPYGIPRRMTE